MELSALLGDKAETTVSFPGGDVQVTYRPSVYTREFEATVDRIAELAARVDRGEDISADDLALVGGRDFYERKLCEFVASWSLTVGGKPLPVTPEALNEHMTTAVLVVFFFRLVQAVQGEAGAGRKPTQTLAQTVPNPPIPLNRAARRAQARSNGNG